MRKDGKMATDEQEGKILLLGVIEVNLLPPTATKEVILTFTASN